jgi:hypothetical protein
VVGHGVSAKTEPRPATLDVQGSGSLFVSVTREDLAEDLLAYGEHDLAVRALELSDRELGRVGVIAGRLLLDDEHATPSGTSMLLAKACAVAAVEVMEGTPRPLRRQRRRSVPEPARAPAHEPLPGKEKPRDVFLSACADVARVFETRGFRYAKSGPHMSRRSGEFTFEVAFASSHHNVAGGHVGLTVYAGVLSNALRKWRRDQGMSSDDANNRVAGGMVQNLKPGMPVASWDVADSRSRPAILRHVERAIETAALPYFELFADEDALARRLETDVVPCFYAREAIEWLLSRGMRESATRHAKALLADRRLRRQYERARRQMQRARIEMIPWAPIMEAEGLAYAALAYGLDY